MLHYIHSFANMTPQRWKRNMFFTGVRNTTLFKMTGGGFPVSDISCQLKTHPIFVLQITSRGPVVCQKKKKNWYDKDDRRYILEGTWTSINYRIQATTYLAEEHRFCIPRGMEYFEVFIDGFTNINNKNYPQLFCMGIIKDKDIKG